MKRFLKYLLIFFFIPFLSFTFVSLLFSNEKSIAWLFESISEELGYQSKISVSDLDWSLTKSRISLSELSIQEEDRGNSIYSDSVVLNIDLLNLIKQKNFLLIELEKATAELKNFDLSESYSRNKFTNFILNNSELKLDELNIKGSIKEVDIPRYFYLFSNKEDEGSPIKINIEDTVISKIKLGPLELQDTSLEMKVLSNRLDFVVSNSQLVGKIIVKQPIKEGVEIDLSKLRLDLKDINSTNLFDYLLDNLSIPISFSVDKLALKKKELGSLDLLLTRKKEKLSFNELSFNGSGIDLHNYQDKESKHKNFFTLSRKNNLLHLDFRGKISTQNLSEVFLSFRENNKELNFTAGASIFYLDIKWQGLPNEFLANNILGNISFRIDDFATKEMDSDILGSSDFLSLISLFNVANTFGDLTNINFKEKFNKGFQADRVEGHLEIKNDKIKTLNPIVFNSGSGEFKWEGTIEKTSEGELGVLDLDVVITLPLREYLPAYALILGGPLTAATVYIAGKAFKKPLNKLSSGRWKLSGTLENPKSEFVEWFE